MIKIALYLWVWADWAQNNSISLEMFSYVKNAYSLLGSLKGLPGLGHGSKHLPSQVLL